jgi:hypothetical protein
MRSLSVFLVAVVLVPTLAFAQAKPALDVYLEQRVPEELAANGTPLSRHAVRLDVELVGDKLIISLVDAATGRVAASTKLDAVPADREAVLASVTQMTTSLAAQLQPTPGSSDIELRAAINEAREERRAQAVAEQRYREEAITFGDDVTVSTTVTNEMVTTSTSRRWVALQGETHKRLEGREFYDVIGRDDLAGEYQHRRNMGLGFAITGGAVAFGGLALGAATKSPGVVVVGGGGGLLVALIGAYYLAKPHPVSESEAHELAKQHNSNLRRKYRLIPYASPHGGGMALGGQF